MLTTPKLFPHFQIGNPSETTWSYKPFHVAERFLEECHSVKWRLHSLRPLKSFRYENIINSEHHDPVWHSYTFDRQGQGSRSCPPKQRTTAAAGVECDLVHIEHRGGRSEPKAGVKPQVLQALSYRTRLDFSDGVCDPWQPADRRRC